MITMALRLTGQRCLVIGGGAVAERRIGLFLKEGAKVTVVSPEVTAKIAEWAADNQLVWQKAAYDESVDLAADFVLLARVTVSSMQCVLRRPEPWGPW